MMVRPTHMEASVQKSVGGTAFSALHQAHDASHNILDQP